MSPLSWRFLFCLFFDGSRSLMSPRSVVRWIVLRSMVSVVSTIVAPRIMSWVCLFCFFCFSVCFLFCFRIVLLLARISDLNRDIPELVYHAVWLHEAHL